MIKHIQAGSLAIDFTYGESRLDELIDFASRENQKRGFLFVSKVLGKHIPVKPSVMRGIYNELAELCTIDSDTFVIGMAETATGLGAGLADSLATIYPDLNVFYQHTTRHHLESPVWFTIQEIHSHAIDHILYRPNDSVYQGIQDCERVVLVDDETTTGSTLIQLAEGVLALAPAIKELVIVTLVSWLKKEKTKIFKDLAVPVRFVQLIKGEFSFTPDPTFITSLPQNVDDGVCYESSRDDLGRTGLKMPYQLTVADGTLDLGTTGSPAVIVGTGEHLYQPFLLAEQLEQTADVLFQSTTRSPILKGDAIKSKTCFNVSDGKLNFIYNLPDKRKKFILCESESLSRQNGLLNGQRQEM